jgi:hypothetical protein
MKATDYRYIRLWGRKLGSYDYYITAQQEKAALENAPKDAIFKRHGTEEWATADEKMKAELDELERRLRG